MCIFLSFRKNWKTFDRKNEPIKNFQRQYKRKLLVLGWRTCPMTIDKNLFTKRLFYHFLHKRAPWCNCTKLLINPFALFVGYGVVVWLVLCQCQQKRDLQVRSKSIGKRKQPIFNRKLLWLQMLSPSRRPRVASLHNFNESFVCLFTIGIGLLIISSSSCCIVFSILIEWKQDNNNNT